MAAEHSPFGKLSAFIKKRHRAIVVAWLVALVISTPLILGFFSAISFNVANSNALSVPNSESERAQAVIDAQFPAMNTTSSPVIVVFQDGNVYSTGVKEGILSLNRTLAADPQLANFSGVESVYGVEASLLDSTVPGYVGQLAGGIGPASNSSDAGAAWDTAAMALADRAASTFASSPLFTVNATSLYGLLAGLNANSTTGEIQAAVSGVLASESILDYPYALSAITTRDFVSPQNTTMIFEVDFSSPPSNGVIAETKTDVHASSLAGLGTVYVTGSPVITADFENAAQPALDNSIVPGLALSILVAGLLFLSPVAALVPVLIGGLAIGISLGGVYGLIVVVQHGQINFAVPFLMILTMLGLAVDYSVLQLRRTKEGRAGGKSIDESVAVSVRWAGQAVLTAGSTVIVAYIVLAVTKVPFFGAVGTAIALGVAILLAASMTLLPSLELMFGDRLFWPRDAAHLHPKVKPDKTARIDRLTQRTLSKKVVISVAITLLAAGAFYLTYETPSGFDITRLIPNFESNQGLTVIDNNFGGGTVAPTQIAVTFPSPITDGGGGFNQSQLGTLDRITSAIAGSDGVESVSSPTSPYGSEFNYSYLSTLPSPVAEQYLTAIDSQIGLNNRTALITVGLSAPAQSPQAIAELDGVESAVGALALPAGVTVLYGGTTQSTIDTLNLINGVLPTVLLILAVGVYFILFLQLRSIFTPLRLIFTILCSVAFALALLSLSFYYALGIPIVGLAPLFVIVTMLGVGIDYDIFLVTRIREEALNGRSDFDAIRTAVGKTWVTLFGLGLILSSVFASLVVSGIGLFQEIGVSVASAVLVDVGIVILFFVPSLMGIAKSYNWWPGKVRADPRVGSDHPAAPVHSNKEGQTQPPREGSSE